LAPAITRLDKPGDGITVSVLVTEVVPKVAVISLVLVVDVLAVDIPNLPVRMPAGIVMECCAQSSAVGPRTATGSLLVSSTTSPEGPALPRSVTVPIADWFAATVGTLKVKSPTAGGITVRVSVLLIPFILAVITTISVLVTGVVRMVAVPNFCPALILAKISGTTASDVSSNFAREPPSGAAVKIRTTQVVDSPPTTTFVPAILRLDKAGEGITVSVLVNDVDPQAAVMSLVLVDKALAVEIPNFPITCPAGMVIE
jgi:hypothetical protein